jgi:hypothetical protein
MILAGWRGKKRGLGREGNRRGGGKSYFPKVVLDPLSMILYIPSNNLKSFTALQSSLSDRFLRHGRASLG